MHRLVGQGVAGQMGRGLAPYREGAGLALRPVPRSARQASNLVNNSRNFHQLSYPEFVPRSSEGFLVQAFWGQG